MKCWSRNGPSVAAIVLDSSTPHTSPVFKSFALALLCPQKSWSPTSTAKPVGLAVGVAENLFCRVHPVCTSAHNCTQSSPHDSEPPHTPLHRCCRELHHPDTILCHDSKAAQPSSTTHSCPSSPKSLHPHSSHVPHTPDVAPDRISPRSCPLRAVASTATSPFPKLTSCTHAYLHAHASPCVPDISRHTTILSQQQLRDQPLPTKHDSQ